MIRILTVPILVLVILFACDRCHGGARKQVRGVDVPIVWNANPAEDHVTYYVVSWARAGQDFGITDQSKQVFETHCTLSGLAVGPVKIAIRAVNDYGSSVWSDPVDVTVRAADIAPAGDPTSTFVSPPK